MLANLVPGEPVDDRHRTGLLGGRQRLRRFVLRRAGKSRDVGAPPVWRQTFGAAASLRPRERADHRRRVEAAAEGRRDRHVRAQPQRARVEEEPAELLRLLVEIAWNRARDGRACSTTATGAHPRGSPRGSGPRAATPRREAGRAPLLARKARTDRRRCSRPARSHRVVGTPSAPMRTRAGGE